MMIMKIGRALGLKQCRRRDLMLVLKVEGSLGLEALDVFDYFVAFVLMMKMMCLESCISVDKLFQTLDRGAFPSQ